MNMQIDHGPEAREAKYQLHSELSAALNELYRTKNEDYEDSFSRGIDESGYLSALTRIEDKVRRCHKLMVSTDAAKVVDESLLDTLNDLANYSLILLTEYKLRQQ